MTKNLYLVYYPNNFSISGQYEIQEGCFALLDSQNQPQKFDKEQLTICSKFASKRF